MRQAKMTWPTTRLCPKRATSQRERKIQQKKNQIGIVNATSMKRQKMQADLQVGLDSLSFHPCVVDDADLVLVFSFLVFCPSAARSLLCGRRAPVYAAVRVRARRLCRSTGAAPPSGGRSRSTSERRNPRAHPLQIFGLKQRLAGLGVSGRWSA